MSHNEIVTSVFLAHREKVVRKISEFFLGVKAKKVINSSNSVGIVMLIQRSTSH